jgi:hypothetical protein
MEENWRLLFLVPTQHLTAIKLGLVGAGHARDIQICRAFIAGTARSYKVLICL